MNKSEKKNRNWEEFKAVIRQNLEKLKEVLDVDTCDDGYWDFPLRKIPFKPWYCGLKFKKEDAGTYLHFNTPDKYPQFQKELIAFIDEKAKNLDFDFEIPSKERNKVFCSNLYFRPRQEASSPNEYYQWCVDKAIEFSAYLYKFKAQLEGSASSAQPDNGNDPTPKGNSDNSPKTNTKKVEENNSNRSSQSTDIDPTKWEISKEIKTIKDYPIKENIQKIYDIGEYEIAYQENKNTPKYYLTMKNGRPCLSLQNEHKHVLRQIVSWPMCGKGKEKYDYIKGINGEKNPVPRKIEYGSVVDSEKHPHAFSFPDGSRIANPVLHPQFVFLGENWSESGDNATLREDTSWMNGYCEQAEVVRDSKLSGGYFTDFIKFYLATKFTGKDKSDLYSNNNVRLDDGTVFKNSQEEPITWFDVYVNIFKQELELLEKMFQKPEYIIIWGSSLYTLLDDISMKVYKKRFGKLFSGYKVRVFGCHYSKSGNGHTFPLDKPFDNRELLSRRRVYEVTENYNRSTMIDDRRDGHDLRRYDFALLEDKDGHLHAYNGNPDK